MMAPELEQEVTAMSREANNADIIGARFYRRDATIYQLSHSQPYCWLLDQQAFQADTHARFSWSEPCA
ncbi:hypothetical protein ACI2TT_05450 [Ralstonia nicotianae]